MMKLRLAVLAAVALCACAGSVEPLPLGISISTTPAAPAVGDTVTFVTTAQGDNLLGVDIDFGDGGTDGFDIPFGQTARNTFKHVYLAAGTYSAAATIAQLDSTTKTATATVQVH
jgi:hypothetical protein